MLVTNIVTFVLILALLTVVPMIPSILIGRYLAYGLAREKSQLGRPAGLSAREG
jgi:hypothetical protein